MPKKVNGKLVLTSGQDIRNVSLTRLSLAEAEDYPGLPLHYVEFEVIHSIRSFVPMQRVLVTDADLGLRMCEVQIQLVSRRDGKTRVKAWFD